MKAAVSDQVKAELETGSPAKLKRWTTGTSRGSPCFLRLRVRCAWDARDSTLPASRRAHAVDRPLRRTCRQSQFTSIGVPDETIAATATTDIVHDLGTAGAGKAPAPWRVEENVDEIGLGDFGCEIANKD